MKKIIKLITAVSLIGILSQPIAVNANMPQTATEGIMGYPKNNLTLDWYGATPVEYIRAASEVNWAWDHMDAELRQYITQNGWKIIITNKDIIYNWNSLVPERYMQPGEYDIFGFHENTNKVIYVTTRKSDLGTLGVGTGNTLAHECAHIGIIFIPGFAQKYYATQQRRELASELYSQETMKDEIICDNYAWNVMCEYYATH